MNLNLLKIILVALIFFYKAGFAQTKKANVQQHQNDPVYIIDSIKVTKNILNYINPNDIDSINVSRSLKYPKGAILIKLKNHSTLLKIINDKWLSLNDIYLNKAGKSADFKHPVLFFLNNELVTDTTDIRIPSACLYNVTITPASEIPYLRIAFPNAITMYVSDKPPAMYIRGIGSN